MKQPEETSHLSRLNEIFVALVISGLVYQYFLRYLPEESTKSFNQFGYLAISGLILSVVSILLRTSPFSAFWNQHNFRLVIDLLAIVVCLASIRSIRPYEEMPNTHWEGFGTTIAMTTGFLALLTVILFPKLRYLPALSNQIVRFGAMAIAFFLLVRSLPGIIQPPNALLNINDQTYIVLEETLAQYSGFTPDVDFLRVYSSIFGWLFVGFDWLNLPDSYLMPTIIWFYNALTLANLMIASLIVWLVAPRRRALSLLWITASIVVMNSVAGREGATTSIYSNLGWVVRFNLPLLSLLCIAIASRISNPIGVRFTVGVAGIFTGLSIVNSPDYGLLFGVAVLSVLAFLKAFGLQRGFPSGILLGSLVITVVLYLVALAGYTSGFSLEMYLSLVSAAQVSDVYTIGRIGILGPHLIMFAVAFLTIRQAISVLRTSDTASERPTNCKPITALICGTWLVLTSFRWLVAAQPVGLPMGGYWLHTAVCAGLTIATSEKFGFSLVPIQSWRLRIQVLPAVMLVVLPLVATLQLPDWKIEIERIRGKADSRGWASGQDRAPADGWTKSFMLERGTSRYPTQWMQALVNFADASAEEGKQIGYYGILANTVQLITGIESVTPTSAPEHMRFGEYFRDQSCSKIFSLTSDRLITVFGTEFPCPHLEYLGQDESGLIGIWKYVPDLIPHDSQKQEFLESKLS